MDTSKVTEIAQKCIEGTDMFIVECTCTPSNDITLILDSDTAIQIDTCAKINHAVDEAFDRDTEDYSLTVMSAGIGEPLKMVRQYKKLVGSSIEVLLLSGIKILAKLDAADEQGITVSYDEKVAVEGKKKKELQHTVQTYAFSEIKTAREYLDFK